MNKSLSALFGATVIVVFLSITSHAADSSLKVEGMLDSEKKEGYEDIKTTKRSRFEEEETVSKHMNMDKVRQRLFELSYLNEQESEQSTDIFSGRFTFANLFSSQRKQGLYNGFYRAIGTVDTDSNAKFTFTGGYFLSHDRGEFLLGYRLLSAKIRETLPGLGNFEEQGVENAAVLTYSKHLNSLVGAINGNLFYSRLTSDSDSVTLESSDKSWERITVKTGSGDVETWHTTLGYGIGSEGWNNPVVRGLRLDVGAGYEEVYYREFDVVPETSKKGFLGYVKLGVLTPLGKIRAQYRDGQSADVGSIEWQAGSLRLFWNDYSYDGSASTSVLGFGISGNFNDLMDFPNYIKNFFRKPQRLFRKELNGYDNINFVEPNDIIEGESKFITKPRTYGIVEDVKYRRPPSSVSSEKPVIGGGSKPASTADPEPESFDDLVNQLQPNQAPDTPGKPITQDPYTPAGAIDIAPGTDTQDQTPPSPPMLILPAEDNPFLINQSLLDQIVVQSTNDPPTIY